jgi:hypothetical protein
MSGPRSLRSLRIDLLNLIEECSGGGRKPRRGTFFNNGNSKFRPMSSQISDVVCTCQRCGHSLTVPGEAIEKVHTSLSPELKARMVLEDHGWNWFTDPPLCSSCNAAEKWAEDRG